jgi:hypothetical protein
MTPGECLLGIVKLHHGFSSHAEFAAGLWPHILKLAERHRVVGCLTAAKTLGLEASDLEVLRTILQGHAQNQLRARSNFAGLAQQLQQAEVDFLVFKGMALQDSLYQGCFRTWGDIDVICRPEHLARMRRILAKSHFQLLNEPRHSFPSVFIGDNALEIDVHTSFIEPYVMEAPNFDEVFSRRVSPQGSCYDTLDPIDHLLVLLLHGLKHQWCRLQWLLDVALALQSLGEDSLLELEERARQIRALRAIRVGIRLTTDVLSAPPARMDLTRNEHATLLSLCDAYKRRLFLELPNSMWMKGKNSLLHLRALEGTTRRMKYLTGRFGNYLTLPVARKRRLG